MYIVSKQANKQLVIYQNHLLTSDSVPISHLPHVDSTNPNDFRISA